MNQSPCLAAVFIIVCSAIGCDPGGATSIRKSDPAIVADPEPEVGGEEEEQGFMEEELN